MTDYFNKPLAEMTEEQLRYLVELMDKYAHSEEWAFLQSVMNREMAAAAREIAKPKAIPNEMLHYQRGAMWAAESFLSLPLKLKAQLDNELFMKRANNQANPAKAGKGNIE